MRIKIKACLSGKKTYNVGDVTEDFSADEAKRLINKGYAEKEEANANKANNTANKKTNKPKRS